MGQTETTPTFSIVIAWDTARVPVLDRARQMLRNLRSQIAALSRPERRPEIFLVYDRRGVDGSAVRRVVDEEFQPDPTAVVTHLIATEGLPYYEQKNFGARLASGDLILHLDCDVVPEPGWLAAMLGAFRDPTVSVVAGETYIQYTGLYSKAVALFWSFGLRDPSSDLVPTTFFHANNAAFRAAVLEAHPFPAVGGHRIQSSVLSERLRHHGIGIYRQKAARAAHPPLLGRSFVTRALNNGRDDVVEALLAHESGSKIKRIYWNYVSCLRRAYGRFRRDGARIELTPVSAAAAYTVAWAYFTLQAIGALITYFRPALAERLFPA